MALFVDKHRPKSLAKLDYHKKLSHQLQQLAESDDLPHLLFYGPNGAGKKTRISALLRQIFGAGVEKLRLEHRVFELPNASKTKIELTTTASNHHIEINPSDAGFHDRVVVNTVIKEIARLHWADLANTYSITGCDIVELRVCV